MIGKMNIDIEKLKEFLKKAKQNTYASENKSKKREDGAKCFRFSNSSYEYEDVYFGSNKFAGQEIVKYNGVLIWSMVYYGGIIKDVLTEDALYNRYLKKFLSKVDEIPARGQNQQKDKNGNDEIIYNNLNIGDKDITHFRGREFITYNGKTIYELFYAGGIIK